MTLDYSELMIEEDFFNLIGDILYDILDQQLKDGSLQYVDTDNREDSSHTSDLQ